MDFSFLTAPFLMRCCFFVPAVFTYRSQGYSYPSFARVEIASSLTLLAMTRRRVSLRAEGVAISVVGVRWDCGACFERKRGILFLAVTLLWPTAMTDALLVGNEFCISGKEKEYD